MKLMALNNKKFSTFQFFQQNLFSLSEIRFERKVFIKNLDNFQFSEIKFFDESSRELDWLAARFATRNSDERRIK